MPLYHDPLAPIQDADAAVADDRIAVFDYRWDRSGLLSTLAEEDQRLGVSHSDEEASEVEQMSEIGYSPSAGFAELFYVPEAPPAANLAFRVLLGFSGLRTPSSAHRELYHP